MIEEAAQAAGGRHAARRGVRLLDEPQLGELRHRVADRRGRERDREDVRDGARSDRCGLAHVARDDRAQHEHLALAQLRNRSRRSSEIRSSNPRKPPNPRRELADGAGACQFAALTRSAGRRSRRAGGHARERRRSVRSCGVLDEQTRRDEFVDRAAVPEGARRCAELGGKRRRVETVRGAQREERRLAACGARVEALGRIDRARLARVDARLPDARDRARWRGARRRARRRAAPRSTTRPVRRRAPGVAPSSAGCDATRSRRARSSTPRSARAPPRRSARRRARASTATSSSSGNASCPRARRALERRAFLERQRVRRDVFGRAARRTRRDRRRDPRASAPGAAKSRSSERFAKPASRAAAKVALPSSPRCARPSRFSVASAKDWIADREPVHAGRRGTPRGARARSCSDSLRA